MNSDDERFLTLVLDDTTSTDSLVCVTVMKEEFIFDFSDVALGGGQLDFIFGIACNSDFAKNLVVPFREIIACVSVTGWNFFLEFD